MAGGHAVADQRQQVVREGLGVRELQAHQVVDRLPVVGVGLPKCSR